MRNNGEGNRDEICKKNSKICPKIIIIICTKSTAKSSVVRL